MKPGWRAGPVVAALIGAGVVAADIATGHHAVLIGLLIICSLLLGFSASARITVAGAVACVLAAALAGLWNGSFERWSYWVPLTVVCVGSIGGAAVAVLRRRAEEYTARIEALARVGTIADGTGTVEENVQDVLAALVPALIDFAVLDVFGADGQGRRLGVRLGHRPDLTDRVAARPLNVRGALAGARTAVADGRTVLLEHITEGDRAAMAHGPEDLALLRELGLESSLNLPLVARGRALGVLSLGTARPRRPFSQDDVRFAETLAGRIALALDNAGLTEELSSSEHRLATILAEVDAAITARDVHGRMLFANQAAADLLQLPDAEAVMTAPPGVLMERFEVYDEQGDPVRLDDLPGTRLLRGEPDPPPLIVRNVVKATGEERWLLNKATAVRDADGRAVLAINVIEDVTQTKRREIGQRLLAEAGRALASTMDLEETLQRVADVAVPGLADWAGVDLKDARGAARTVAVAHRDPDKVRLGWELRRRYPADGSAEDGLTTVLDTGISQLITEIPDELLVASARSPEHLELLRAIGLGSTMIVPIVAGAEVLGALSYVSSTARRFDDQDLALAEALGRQAGVAVQNARLFTERADIAHTLQIGLLPDTLPDIAGWDIGALYRPAGEANEVGGDFYDAVRFRDGWVLIMGDVTGKGAAAAALTALTRYTFRTALETTNDPLGALTHLNEALRRREDLSLCSVVIVVFPDDSDEIEAVAAGHPLPLRRTADGAVASVGTNGPLLGAIDDPVWTPRRAVLRPGEQLLIFTDGVPDTVGAGERFGDERLRAAVQGAGTTAGDLVDAVVGAVDAFRVGPQPDDIALVGLRREAVAALAA